MVIGQVASTIEALSNALGIPDTFQWQVSPAARGGVSAVEDCGLPGGTVFVQVVLCSFVLLVGMLTMERYVVV